MTHIDPALIEAAIPYFETRAKVAALLKEAGVKKHAREYVAEVLLDAGVIDLDELAQLAPDEEPEEEPDALTDAWLNKVAWWNNTRGHVVGISHDTSEVTFVPDSGRTRVLPASWLTHEKPEWPTPDIDDAD